MIQRTVPVLLAPRIFLRLTGSTGIALHRPAVGRDDELVSD